MNLWTLFRRRRLAYELLSEYEREREPFDFREALRRLEAYNTATAASYERGFQYGAQQWREAVERKLKDWPE